MELEEFAHPTLQIVREEQEVKGFNELVGELEGSDFKPLSDNFPPM